MPIDPSIAAGVQQIQPPQNNALLAQGIQPIQLRDPLEQYSNMMRAQYMGSQNTLNQQEIARTAGLNRALSSPNAMNPDGTMNLEAIRQGLGPDAGSAFPALAKSAVEMQAQMAQTQKAKQDAFGTYAGQARDMWSQISKMDPTDPQTLQKAIDLVKAEHSGPYAAQLAQLGATPEGSIASLQQAFQNKTFGSLATNASLNAEKLAENDFSKPFSIGGRTLVLRSSKYGDPNSQLVFNAVNTPSPDAVLSSNTQLTTTGMNNAQSGANTAMTVAGAAQRQTQVQAGEILQTLYPAAQAAPAIIAQNNEVKQLLNGPGAANTGPGSELFTKLEAIGARFGVPGLDNVASTQELVKKLNNGLMSQAGQFKSEGAGFPRMTNNDLAFMKDSTPNPNMVKDAIVSLINRSTLQAHYVQNLANNRARGLYGVSPQMQKLYPQLAPVRDDIMPADLSGGTTVPGTVGPVKNPDGTMDYSHAWGGR